MSSMTYATPLCLELAASRRLAVFLAATHLAALLVLPFSGLDVRTAKIMKDVIRIHVEKGGAVLLCTHVMEVAEGLCDRVGIIDDGILVAVGTLDELQRMTHEEGANLERVFLALTEQAGDVRKGVDILREALAD